MQAKLAILDEYLAIGSITGGACDKNERIYAIGVSFISCESLIFSLATASSHTQLPMHDGIQLLIGGLANESRN